MRHIKASLLMLRLCSENLTQMEVEEGPMFVPTPLGSDPQSIAGLFLPPFRTYRMFHHYPKTLVIKIHSYTALVEFTGRVTYLQASMFALLGKMVNANIIETRPPATIPEILIRATTRAPAYPNQCPHNSPHMKK